MPFFLPAMSALEIDRRLRKRAMLRIANHGLVSKEVENFRGQFPEWTAELNDVLLVLGQKTLKKKQREKRAKRKLLRQKKREERLKSKTSKQNDLPGQKNESSGDESESSDEEESTDDENDASLSRAPGGQESSNEKQQESYSEDVESDANGDVVDANDDGVGANESGDESDADTKAFAATLKSLIKENAGGESDESSGLSDDDGSDQESKSGMDEDKKDKGKLFVEGPKVPKVEANRNKSKPAEKSVPKPESFVRSEGEVVIKALRLDASESSSSSDDDDDDDKRESEQALTKMKSTNASSKKDSFFMGGASESDDDDDDDEDDRNANQDSSHPYFSNNPPQNRRERREFERWRSGERGGKFKPRGNHELRGRGRGRGEFSGRGSRGQPGSLFRGRGTFPRGRGDSRPHGQRLPHQETDEELHPSWVAKRKNQVSIGQFSGKKIKFGDGDDDVTSSNRMDDRSGSKPPTSSSLHPSWEAKRKSQVPSIGQFSGKKTRFDDDDVTRSSNQITARTHDRSGSKPPPSSSLHPSWAAKRGKTIGIQSFQGKKIVFGDDD